jgi:hypothetical protein
MTVKASVFFVGTEPVCGWTETVYFPGNDLVGFSGALLTGYSPKRMALSPSDIKIIGWRLNIIGSRKSSLTSINDIPGTFGSPPATEPWSALLLNFLKPPNYSINRYMHGVPDSEVTSGLYTPSGPYSTNFGTFQTWMASNTVLWARNPAIVGSPKAEVSFTAINPKKMVSHRIGRPFDLLVGRRLSA